ncbi:unnamed protein product [Schistosoma margrebowiei]|uniref:Uncharacterized protein n=1 Tax=Schistosoma margrebowiei TaxID=48269 RepID=A0A183M456_9TREM|nr:unnamed protein product [Schistosoma margrebowiei]
MKNSESFTFPFLSSSFDPQDTVKFIYCILDEIAGSVDHLGECQVTGLLPLLSRVESTFKYSHYQLSQALTSFLMDDLLNTMTGRRKDGTRKPLKVLLNDSQAKSIFQEQLGKQLGSHVCDAHPDAAWNDIRKTVETAVISASTIDARKLIPPGSEHNEERSQLKCKRTRSLRNDREQWWVAKAREMKSAAAVGNSRQLFRLVEETGIRNTIVSETISEKDGHIIHSQSRRLE